MQNYPECSPRRLSVPTSENARAGAIVTLAFVAEAQALPAPAGRRTSEATTNAGTILDRLALLVGIPAYSIRVLRSAGPPCATCGGETGMGAVGHCGDDPTCDRCMLDQCEPLGMLLALVAVTRAYAVTGTVEPGAARESLVELGGFARIFEQVVAKWGPARLITNDDRLGG